MKGVGQGIDEVLVCHVALLDGRVGGLGSKLLKGGMGSTAGIDDGTEQAQDGRGGSGDVLGDEAREGNKTVHGDFARGIDHIRDTAAFEMRLDGAVGPGGLGLEVGPDDAVGGADDPVQQLARVSLVCEIDVVAVVGAAVVAGVAGVWRLAMMTCGWAATSAAGRQGQLVV